MRLREYAGATLVVLLSSATAAQAQWKVDVHPSRNPLPIGACGQVSVSAFDPAKKGTARTAGGNSVSNAGYFDMAVEASDKNGASGRFESSSIWTVCACRAATVGSRAKITATYPAKALPEKLRAGGITAVGEATFTIVAGNNSTYNPPGCMAKTVVATPPSGAEQPLKKSTTPAVPVQPPAGPTTIGTMATPPAAPPGTRTGTVTPPVVPTGAPPTGSTPTGTELGAATPLSSPRPASPLSTPGPLNVRVVAGQSPLIQQLVWDRPVGITGYQVFFKINAALTEWTLMTGTPLKSEMYWDSAYRQPGVMYRVTALYANGGQGSTDYVYSNPPPLKVPASLKAIEVSKGKVRLSWPSVPYVTGYRIMGSGRPADGTPVKSSYQYEGYNESFELPDLPLGDYTWQVTADYGGVYQTAGLPTASISLLSNRFRVSILGFKVLQETNDDLLSRDGKNNEVYAVALVCTGVQTRNVTDQFGKQVLDAHPPGCATMQSAVHGDVNGFPGRIKAGTGSATGGITTGDLIGAGPTGTTAGSATTFPFLLWEGELLPTVHAVWMAPSLWEAGLPASTTIDAFARDKKYELDLWSKNMKYSFGVADNWTAWGNAQSVLNGAFVPENPGNLPGCGYGDGDDRLIGLIPGKGSSGPSGICWVFGLTREKAEAVLRGAPQEPGKPVGVVTMDLVDAVSGHYLMYIKLERVPPIS